MIGRMPKPQRLYVDTVSGDLCVFDSWLRWPNEGFYGLSTGRFIRLKPRRMRVATEAETRLFYRAKRSRVEASSNG